MHPRGQKYKNRRERKKAMMQNGVKEGPPSMEFEKS
jgi:hypothetical protein